LALGFRGKQSDAMDDLGAILGIGECLRHSYLHHARGILTAMILFLCGARLSLGIDQ
jgi:hypothetical protein